MYHLTHGPLLVGALALLILVIVLGVKALLGDRRAKAAPFRNYFGPEYDRDLLRQSDLSESDGWRAGDESRSTPMRLRGFEAGRPRSKISDATGWDRDQD